MKKQAKLDNFMREGKNRAKADKMKIQQSCSFSNVGWKWVKLKDVVTAVGGGTPSKSNPRFWGGKIPWASPKDIKNFEIYDTQHHITEEGLKKSSTKLIPANSVLVVFRGSLLLKKKKVPVAINRVPMAINQDIKALIPKQT